jgi:hypothetical protein
MAFAMSVSVPVENVTVNIILLLGGNGAFAPNAPKIIKLN